MQATKNDIHLAEEVIKTLLYFDIFLYPLTAQEIFGFLGVDGCTPEDVTDSLSNLAEKELVFRFGDFYSLHPDQKNIRRRIKGNREAEKWLKIAEKKARFIAMFPFVQGVMASGSLSKGYMDEHSDLDFFIVTAPNRLWIARTLLVLYKRIFLFNSHKLFCVNYFVDNLHLEIEEKNIFTATELATLIPLYNHGCYESLLASNRWVLDFFPHFKAKTSPTLHKALQHKFRKIPELFLNPFSATLDKFFMRITLRRWNKIYAQKFEKNDFDIAFKTRRYVSKNHPNYYQKKILDLYQIKLLEYKSSLGGLTRYD